MNKLTQLLPRSNSTNLDKLLKGTQQVTQGNSTSYSRELSKLLNANKIQYQLNIH